MTVFEENLRSKAFSNFQTGYSFKMITINGKLCRDRAGHRVKAICDDPEHHPLHRRIVFVLMLFVRGYGPLIVCPF